MKAKLEAELQNLQVPEQILNLLNEFVLRAREILSENLTGIYLHGSAVMGCFNPQKSDIDLIILRYFESYKSSGVQKG